VTHRAARFEIVHTDAEQPWHGRFVAGNGRIVWTTETYTRRGRVMDAIRLLTVEPHSHRELGDADDRLFVVTGGQCLEVRDVDERGTRP
jgi:uncharacterized protein YegP (UPF0339 family)